MKESSNNLVDAPMKDTGEAGAVFTWVVLSGDDARWIVRVAIDAVVAYAYGPTRDQFVHMRSLKLGFRREPILFREGGSIPIVNDFKTILGADALMLGLSLDADNPHSPNENFDLDAFASGMRMSAYLWQELAPASLH